MIKNPFNQPIVLPTALQIYEKSSKKDWYGTQDQQHSKPKKKEKNEKR